MALGDNASPQVDTYAKVAQEEAARIAAEKLAIETAF